MRSAVLICAALLVVSARANSHPEPGGENNYVSFNASVKQGARATGSLLFRLSPRKGIHINLDPPMSVSFDSGAPVKPAGKLEVPRMGKFPYLDTARAITQPFTLSIHSAEGRTKPPSVTLKGILTYFYCSDAEGWCSRCRQPFAVAVPAAK